MKYRAVWASMTPKRTHDRPKPTKRAPSDESMTLWKFTGIFKRVSNVVVRKKVLASQKRVQNTRRRTGMTGHCFNID